MEELRGYIAAAKTLGTEVLRLWCGNRSGADMTEEERRAFLTVCREAARIAEAEDVTLCMECHKKTFTENLSDALWLMEEVASPHFKMYWQPFQWKSVAENLAYAKAIAPYATYLHVFNWKDDRKLPLGEALEEWQAYLACFTTPRTLLLEFMPDGRIESLERETDSLRQMIGGRA
jgi:sugar phosphate isomerase/epimerase